MLDAAFVFLLLQEVYYYTTRNSQWDGRVVGCLRHLEIWGREMERTGQEVGNFLPLNHSEHYILLVLGVKPRHGYEIMKEIEQEFGMGFKQGTIYGALGRMLKSGLIEESDSQVDEALDGTRRRYFRVTELGERVLEAERQRQKQAWSYAKGKSVEVGGAA